MKPSRLLVAIVLRDSDGTLSRARDVVTRSSLMCV